MTKFIMGLLFGLILGIGGTAAFLISAQGGDYLVVTSPRVRELEASLKQADQERTWLREQVKNSADLATKLESRFLSLATRFEELGTRAAGILEDPAAPKAAAKKVPPPVAGNASANQVPGAAKPAAAGLPPAAATPPPAAATPAAKGAQKAPAKPKKKTAGGSATRPTPAEKS